MKVGDLVTLSSYGADRNYNSHITMADSSQVGLVISIHERCFHKYRILWSKVTGSDYRIDRHARKEIKFARGHQ